MYSKKDLERQFSISANTVTETLAACGLSTSKRQYTDEEIQERFIPARKMLESKQYTYEDVKGHFAMKDAAVPGGSAAQKSESSPESFIGQIEVQIAQSVQEVVRDAVASIIPLIPQMVNMALSEQAQSGRIKEAFETMRRDFAEGNGRLGSGGSERFIGLGSSAFEVNAEDVNDFIDDIDDAYEENEEEDEN